MAGCWLPADVGQRPDPLELGIPSWLSRLMASEPSVSTWDLLKNLGFYKDDTLAVPGLSFDFGKFKLSAICGANRHFVNSDFALWSNGERR